MDTSEIIKTLDLIEKNISSLKNQFIKIDDNNTEMEIEEREKLTKEFFSNNTWRENLVDVLKDFIYDNDMNEIEWYKINTKLHKDIPSSIISSKYPMDIKVSNKTKDYILKKIELNNKMDVDINGKDIVYFESTHIPSGIKFKLFYGSFNPNNVLSLKTDESEIISNNIIEEVFGKGLSVNKNDFTIKLLEYDEEIKTLKIKSINMDREKYEFI